MRGVPINDESTQLVLNYILDLMPSVFQQSTNHDMVWGYEQAPRYKKGLFVN